MNILGAEYTIIKKATKEKYPILGDNDGVCDFTTKRILIADMPVTDETMQDMDAWEKKVVRHEVIHAFLFESGLDACSKNGSRNEELVDWIAIQSPKLFKVLNTLNVL
jgi:hypothetical protein